MTSNPYADAANRALAEVFAGRDTLTIEQALALAQAQATLALALEQGRTQAAIVAAGIEARTANLLAVVEQRRAATGYGFTIYPGMHEHMADIEERLGVKQ